MNANLIFFLSLSLYSKKSLANLGMCLRINLQYNRTILKILKIGESYT